MRAAALVVALTLVFASAALAQTSPYPVRHEALGELWLEAIGADRVLMGRTTIQPGVTMPPTRFNGEWFARVDAGVLTIDALDGFLQVDDYGDDPDEWPNRGGSDDLEAGTRIRFGPDAVMTWSNEGDRPLVVLTNAIVADGLKPMVEVDPDAAEPAAEPTERGRHRFAGDVVKRVVLKGPSQGLSHYDYRITVRDRSGQLIGARVPHERELQWLQAGTSWIDDLGPGGIRLGPVVSPARGRGTEMLVTWWSGACGPLATVDVGDDLSAIKIVDRTPSCDLMPLIGAVVLRFMGRSPLPEEIEATLVER